MVKTLNKFKSPDELQKMIKYMKKASKAKESMEKKQTQQSDPPMGAQPRAPWYQRLDTVSAQSMSKVKTGEPELDRQVEIQAKRPKYPKDADPSSWRNSIKGIPKNYKRS